MGLVGEFYMRGSVDGVTPVTRAVALSARMSAFDRRQLLANQERIAELWSRGEPDLMIVSAHDPELLARARAVRASS